MHAAMANTFLMTTDSEEVHYLFVAKKQYGAYWAAIQLPRYRGVYRKRGALMKHRARKKRC